MTGKPRCTPLTFADLLSCSSSSSRSRASSPLSTSCTRAGKKPNRFREPTIAARHMSSASKTTTSTSETPKGSSPPRMCREQETRCRAATSTGLVLLACSWGCPLEQCALEV
eukprot:CAMPEP_0177286938 /NCGR_PEP_ID=MMETSP0367-20130122/73891_1 /TAXON_ID=447022 ORGANISM="Scrippsiella hangoei-like, Strain SHHI-4" /NCGR_SAMPLE_ID=MMETSP0367 /ASSEMBLY_ACC=CAM_ASM_000362 /LENGTH=111 /DNA_ID=CAMNT_0018744221 /DNA_START=318 /DNA_END=649 /DNA_ORIENTATION=+